MALANNSFNMRQKWFFSNITDNNETLNEEYGSNKDVKKEDNTRNNLKESHLCPTRISRSNFHNKIDLEQATKKKMNSNFKKEQKQKNYFSDINFSKTDLNLKSVSKEVNTDTNKITKSDSSSDLIFIDTKPSTDLNLKSVSKEVNTDTNKITESDSSSDLIFIDTKPSNVADSIIVDLETNKTIFNNCLTLPEPSSLQLDSHSDTLIDSFTSTSNKVHKASEQLYNNLSHPNSSIDKIKKTKSGVQKDTFKIQVKKDLFEEGKSFNTMCSTQLSCIDSSIPCAQVSSIYNGSFMQPLDNGDLENFFSQPSLPLFASTQKDVAGERVNINMQDKISNKTFSVAQPSSFSSQKHGEVAPKGSEFSNNRSPVKKILGSPVCKDSKLNICNKQNKPNFALTSSSVMKTFEKVNIKKEIVDSSSDSSEEETIYSFDSVNSLLNRKKMSIVDLNVDHLLPEGSNSANLNENLDNNDINTSIRSVDEQTYFSPLKLKESLIDQNKNIFVNEPQQDTKIASDDNTDVEIDNKNTMVSVPVIIFCKRHFLNEHVSSDITKPQERNLNKNIVYESPVRSANLINEILCNKSNDSFTDEFNVNVEEIIKDLYTVLQSKQQIYENCTADIECHIKIQDKVQGKLSQRKVYRFPLKTDNKTDLNKNPPQIVSVSLITKSKLRQACFCGDKSTTLKDEKIVCDTSTQTDKISKTGNYFLNENFNKENMSEAIVMQEKNILFNSSVTIATKYDFNSTVSQNESCNIVKDKNSTFSKTGNITEVIEIDPAPDFSNVGIHAGDDENLKTKTIELEDNKKNYVTKVSKKSNKKNTKNIKKVRKKTKITKTKITKTKVIKKSNTKNKNGEIINTKKLVKKSKKYSLPARNLKNCNSDKNSNLNKMGQNIDDNKSVPLNEMQRESPSVREKLDNYGHYNECILESPNYIDKQDESLFSEKIENSDILNASPSLSHNINGMDNHLFVSNQQNIFSHTFYDQNGSPILKNISRRSLPLINNFPNAVVNSQVGDNFCSQDSNASVFDVSLDRQAYLKSLEECNVNKNGRHRNVKRLQNSFPEKVSLRSNKNTNKGLKVQPSNRKRKLSDRPDNLQFTPPHRLRRLAPKHSHNQNTDNHLINSDQNTIKYRPKPERKGRRLSSKNLIKPMN